MTSIRKAKQNGNNFLICLDFLFELKLNTNQQFFSHVGTFPGLNWER